MVTSPLFRQLAPPFPSIVAVLVSEDVQFTPSLADSCRLLLSLKVPVAVNCTLPAVAVPVACCGLTLTPVRVVRSDPQFISAPAQNTKTRTETTGPSRTYLMVGLREKKFYRVISWLDANTCYQLAEKSRLRDCFAE